MLLPHAVFVTILHRIRYLALSVCIQMQQNRGFILQFCFVPVKREIANICSSLSHIILILKTSPRSGRRSGPNPYIKIKNENIFRTHIGIHLGDILVTLAINQFNFELNRLRFAICFISESIRVK